MMTITSYSLAEKIFNYFNTLDDVFTSVFLGVDPEKPPKKENYPVLLIHPVGSIEKNNVNEIQIYFHWGVIETEVEKRGNSYVYKGLEQISNLEKELKKIISIDSQLTGHVVENENSSLNYPYFDSSMIIQFEKPLVIGG